MVRLRKMVQADIQEGTHVLVRIDVNVQVRGGTVDADARMKLEAIKPTIHALIKKRAVITLVSHRGEPKRKDRAFSLEKVAAVLSTCVGHNVKFIAQKPGTITYERIIARAAPGTIMLLENLRFSRGEKANDPMFAKKLARGQDMFINDAFASSHRAHASVVGVTKYLPSFAGLLLQNEVEALEKILRPKKPLLVIIGGAKISSKIETLNALLPKADNLIVGGGIANSFLAAEGLNLSRSLPEKEEITLAEKILKKQKKKIIIPIDVGILLSEKGKKKSVTKKTVLVEDIPDNAEVVDVGPASLEVFAKYIKNAATIVWNGPMGKFEQAPFDRGTMGLVKILVQHAKKGAFVVVGGGETVMAVRRAQVSKHFAHVSTGGGAMLDFLAQGSLVGIEPLRIH